MAQSLAKVYIHLVFGTKYLQPIIDPEIEKELHAYMMTLFREFDSPGIIINNVPDHIHSLFMLSRKFTISQVVEHVKRKSSRWIKTKGELYEIFYWQRGYGAFSVSQSQLKVVQKYIANQKIHHQNTQFKDEYIGLLKKYNIEYDERFIWE